MKNLIIILSLILCFTMDFTQKESHAAFDSLIEYESRTNYTSLLDFVVKVFEDIYTCFIQNIVLNPFELNQTCIPRLITTEGNFESDCDGSGNNMTGAVIGFVLFLITLLVVISLTWIPILGELAWALAGAEFIWTITTCLGNYVLAPHEYINKLKGWMTCSNVDGEVVNTHEKALTAVDVPFFYKCLDHEVPKDLKIGDSRLNDEYGNMTGPSTPYCQGEGINYAINNLSGSAFGLDAKDLTIGSIITRHVGFWELIHVSPRDTCDDSNKDSTYHLTRDNVKSGGAIDPIGFYRLHGGKIQLCSASITGVGVIINGCTYVAPPIETFSTPAAYTDNTRCMYFLSSRSDLNSLGRAINSNVTDNNYSSVGLFLQSDLHILSTVIGCIQDLLTKIVVGTYGNNEDSFLWQIQQKLVQIAQVILILYVSILGIKIISSPQPPQMGEVVMYVLKFAAVVVLSGMAGPKIWYDNNENGSSGLYPLLLQSMNDLSDKVIQSTNNVSPVNMCFYENNGTNILSERKLPVGTYDNLNATQTLNDDNAYIKLTIWDYIDCKIVSYLNFNSCKYTISGMVSFWLISTSIFFPSSFLLGIMSIILIIIVCGTMMRFAHIAILSMFAITILILVSPIMCCFMLFEYTKQTFQSWFKMIIGYVLYPALTFTFLALMISTFDAIFYGQMKDRTCLDTSSCKVGDICSSDNNSIYCNIVKAVYKGQDPTNVDPTLCTLTHGKLLNSFTQDYDIKFLGITIFTTQSVTEESFWGVFTGVLKMMLFAIIFYHLTNSVLQFIESLLSIFGLSSQSRDFVSDIKNTAQKGAELTLTATTGGASKAATAAVKAAKSLSENKE